MSETYFVGNGTGDLINLNPILREARYFYALRRTAEGDLYFTKTDTMLDSESITINELTFGSDEDFPDFEFGTDYFEGRDETHERPYKNLVYDQFKWDSSNLFYYLNENGELVVRVNQAYQYTDPDA